MPDGGSGAADGVVAVMALPASAQRFTATGLDFGFGVFASGYIRAVDYR